MKWLSNISDPCAGGYVPALIGESPEQARHKHQEWLSGKIIGAPQPTEHHTAEELRQMNMVGVYKMDETDFLRQNRTSDMFSLTK